MEGLSKKEKGLMDMDNRVVIAGGGGVRGLNSNGKNTIEIKFKEKQCGNSLCVLLQFLSG